MVRWFDGPMVRENFLNRHTLTRRIVSEFRMPSVEQLIVAQGCCLDHFQAALAAGTTTITHLTVGITLYNHTENTTKLEAMTSMIRRAVRLKSLTIKRGTDDPPIHPPLSFFQALEACATITEIKVEIPDQSGNNSSDEHRLLSPRDAQHFQRITARNQKLALFLANPMTYPTHQLPTLMRQFDNHCPTGRYLLSRCLPEILAFNQIQSAKKRTSKTSPMPKSTRQLRKRRNISYQV